MRYSVCREYNKILLKQMLVNAIVVEAGGFSAHVERTRDSQWSEYPKEYCFSHPGRRQRRHAFRTAPQLLHGSK